MDLKCANEFALQHTRKCDPTVKNAYLKRTYLLICYEFALGEVVISLDLRYMFDRTMVRHHKANSTVRKNGVRVHPDLFNNYDNGIPIQFLSLVNNARHVNFGIVTIRQKYTQWLVLHWCWCANQLGVCRDIRRKIGEMATALLQKDREQLPIGFIKGDRK